MDASAEKGCVVTIRHPTHPTQSELAAKASALLKEIEQGVCLELLTTDEMNTLRAALKLAAKEPLAAEPSGLTSDGASLGGAGTAATPASIQYGYGLCNCDPLKGPCKLGRERKLLTAALQRCYIPTGVTYG